MARRALALDEPYGDVSSFPLLDLATAETLRDRGMLQVAQHAEAHRPNFGDDARAFVLRYLEQHGPTSSEVLTAACLKAGISPPDDRAFGPVYLTLSRRGLIERVGSCKRRRGHGTDGGSIWALAQR